MSDRTKVVIVLLLGVVATSFGDVSISQGVKQAADVSGGWVAQLKATANLYVIGGIVLQLGFFGTYLYALSKEGISFVMPLGGVNYVLVGLIAAVWAQEQLTAQRWVGTVLVAVGVFLVAREKRS